MIEPTLGRYLGALVVVSPVVPSGVVRSNGCVLAGIYHGGLLFLNGHGLRLWVSWVDLWTGHCRLEGTPDAEAIMALVAARVVNHPALKGEAWSKPA